MDRSQQSAPPATARLSRRSIYWSVALSSLLCFGAWNWRTVYHSWLTHRAQTHLAARQPASAIEGLLAILKNDPQHAEAHYLLAKAYRRLGEMKLVRDHLASAVRLGYDNKAIVREQWLALAQSGQMREATPHLPELLIQQTEDVRNVCEAYVNGFFLTNEFAEAFRLLEVWQADFPNDPQPYLFRGQFLESKTRFGDAEAAYREGLQRDPQRQDLQIRLARCLVMLRKYEEGRSLVEQALSKSSDHPEALEILAHCLFEQGLTDDCRKITEDLAKRNPKLSSVRILLSRVYLQDRRIDEARQLLASLAEERPFDLGVRYLLATTLQAVGESKKAAEEFQFVATARDEIARARKLQEKVEMDEPRNIDLRYQLGEILLKYESPEAGAGWMRSVLEIDPKHQAAHQALADYYRRIGAYGQAQEHQAMLVMPSP